MITTRVYYKTVDSENRFYHVTANTLDELIKLADLTYLPKDKMSDENKIYWKTYRDSLKYAKVTETTESIE